MIKDLAELKALQQRLKSGAEAAAKADRERREREAQLAREARLFRDSIGEVQPLKTVPRVLTPMPRPLPVASQRIADDEAVLQESLSDDFSIDPLLEVV